MAASGALPAGTKSYSSTIATASTAEDVTFPDRYGYVTVTNAGSAPIYVRTDGSPATETGADSYVVQPGDTRLFANAERLWLQSSEVIPQGTNEFGGAGNVSSPSSPGTVTPMESLAGQIANPGTSISLVSSSSGVAYNVAAAG